MMSMQKSPLLGIDDLVELSGLSQSHLIRMFKEHLGSTPIQYYNRLRLLEAEQLLLGTTMSIQDIAEKMGYSSPFHFSNRFSQWKGLSPKAFRQK
jgi:AraC family transcriptional regulator